MTKQRLYLFDTTLRDGQQTPGIDFSVEDKIAIAALLDEFGLDYVEGGYPGANPTDTAFFREKRTARAKFVAFGMTKRAGVSASNDPGLAALVQSKSDAICFVAKSWDYHVRVALGCTNEENLESIKSEVRATVEKVIAAGIPGDHLGIHAHDDTGQAVANSLAAVEAGVRQIQGTLNGIGERCGNANLITIIPTLALKPAFADRFVTGISAEALTGVSRLSRAFDELLNRAPESQAPYVGSSAFATKAGIHASALAKEPATYEHVPPEAVGNRRRVMVSDQGGKANFLAELKRRGIDVPKDDHRLDALIAVVKEREAEGYAYEGADASFELLARKILHGLPEFFNVTSFRCMVERRFDANGQLKTVSEAIVKVLVDGEEKMSVAEGHGPVNALDIALRKDLGKYQSEIVDLELADFKVRILNGGTEAITRVLVESHDSSGSRWRTVGVSENIIDASFQALMDSIIYKLMKNREMAGLVAAE